MVRFTRQDAPRRESAFERVAAMAADRDKAAIRQLRLAAKAEERRRLLEVSREVLVEHVVVLQASVDELTQLTRALEARCEHVSALEHRVRVLEAEVRREGRAA